MGAQQEITCSVCKLNYTTCILTQFIGEEVANLTAALQDSCQETQAIAAAALGSLALNSKTDTRSCECIHGLIKVLHECSKDARLHAIVAIKKLAEKSHNEIVK